MSRSGPEDDHKADSKLDEETIKEHYTSHWDLDYLPREEVEAMMNDPQAQQKKAPERGENREQDIDPDENPGRIALWLLLGAAVLFTIGILVLRL